MTLSTFRSFLYRLGKLLGDILAVKKGRVGKRASRRIAGKATGRVFRRLFK